MTDPRTLPELFATVRAICDSRLPSHRIALAALDAIAERQSREGHASYMGHCPCICADCLALRAACKGEKP